MAKPLRIARVMYRFARRAAFSIVSPLAKLAAIAAEKVQPVPWVWEVRIRAALSARNFFPS